MSQAAFFFPGPDLTEADHARLTGQLRRVWDVMVDEEWHTLPEIGAKTKDPEASISAQLRHLRKAPFGGHTVARRRRDGSALYEYRLTRSGNWWPR